MVSRAADGARPASGRKHGTAWLRTFTYSNPLRGQSPRRSAQHDKHGAFKPKPSEARFWLVKYMRQNGTNFLHAVFLTVYQPTVLLNIWKQWQRLISFLHSSLYYQWTADYTPSWFAHLKMVTHPSTHRSRHTMSEAWYIYVIMLPCSNPTKFLVSKANRSGVILGCPVEWLDQYHWFWVAG